MWQTVLNYCSESCLSHSWCLSSWQKLFLEMKAKVKSHLISARRLTDLSTKKRMSLNYVSITVHFFHSKMIPSTNRCWQLKGFSIQPLGKIYSIFLRRFLRSGRSLNKAVVMDNGSNVIKAIKELIIEVQESDQDVEDDSNKDVQVDGAQAMVFEGGREADDESDDSEMEEGVATIDADVIV